MAYQILRAPPFTGGRVSLLDRFKDSLLRRVD